MLDRNCCFEEMSFEYISSSTKPIESIPSILASHNSADKHFTAGPTFTALHHSSLHPDLIATCKIFIVCKNKLFQNVIALQRRRRDNVYFIMAYFKLKVRRDRAHKNRHLIGIIWIREQYGTPDANGFQSYIFR